MPTNISWVRNPDGSKGETWNPVTGCTPVSEGCAHCYARTFAERFRGVPGHPYEQGFDVTLHPDRLGIPLKRMKPTTYFVGSMTDVFHEDIPDEYIDRVFATMAICGAVRQTCKWAGCDHDERSGCWMEGEGRPNPRHTFQVLTKRPERMREYLSSPDRPAQIEAVGNDPEWSIQWGEPADMIDGQGWPLPNVRLGVSVENQARADERYEYLRNTPAAVRFYSLEPLLGPIPKLPLEGISWVILGGESGPGARLLVERCNHWPATEPCHGTDWRPRKEALRWVHDIRDQCQAAGIPFWFKQWGPRAGQGTLLDGREHKEMPRQEVRA